MCIGLILAALQSLKYFPPSYNHSLIMMTADIALFSHCVGIGLINEPFSRDNEMTFKQAIF